jgi:hypothetical protein
VLVAVLAGVLVGGGVGGKQFPFNLTDALFVDVLPFVQLPDTSNLMSAV